VFRAVALGSRVSTEPLADDSASRIVKRYARAGSAWRRRPSPATACAAASSRQRPRAGPIIFKMAEVSRHRSLDTLRGYIGRVDLFKEHAGAAFL
jgi:hypothetical protein